MKNVSEDLIKVTEYKVLGRLPELIFKALSRTVEDNLTYTRITKRRTI